MDISALRTFLSEDNVKMHIGHMRNLKLRASVNEKSIPEIKGKSTAQILQMNMKRAVRDELAQLLFDISLHECYFRSFTLTPRLCPEVRKYYSSEDAFCYEMLSLAAAAGEGFLCVFQNRRARPEIKTVGIADFYTLREAPRLAVDLAEHAYFLDYGFKREEYLRAAISHVDLSKLSNGLDIAK